jgi:hypothetical protein
VLPLGVRSGLAIRRFERRERDDLAGDPDRPAGEADVVEALLDASGQLWPITAGSSIGQSDVSRITKSGWSGSTARREVARPIA